MHAFKKLPPLFGTALLGLLLCVVSPTLRAQVPSFQVAPTPTKVRTGATVGVGAVVSGSAAASYVWTKAGVVVGSGSAVAANDWKSVAAGAAHTLALKNDGSLWGWGSNQSGQLALVSAGAANDRRNAPARIGSASDWAGVFASGGRSCAIKKDGTAWYWGGTAGSAGMNKVAGDQFWESAAFGGTGAMYLVSLGGVYVFRTDMGSAPSPIGTSRDWASLSAWGEMVVALKRDGTLWGYNPMGAGMGQSSPNGGFYMVRSGRWKAACAGPGYAVALREDGTLWAWQRMAGGGSGWALFNNSWQTQYTPRQLGSRSDWKSLAADVLPLAVDADGGVHQVAEGWSRRIGEIPVACRGVSGRTAENSKSNSEGLALGADGTLWAWGGNDNGQLGNLQDMTSFWGTVRYDAVQVGVHESWGLSSPVLGVPLGLVLPNFQTGNLGVYELLVNNVASGSVALAEWTSQPETRRLTAGASLQLAADGSLGNGTAPTYQWYRNGVAITGATASTYSLANAQTSASGVYWLEIRRGGVTARSESAAVVVEESALAEVHSLLAAKSYAAASNSLATLLQATPSHPAANVLKAFTDLYLLIQDSKTTTMLTQLGFTGSADPLNFTLQHAGFPAGGALTSEARKWMRDTLYPKLREAETRLGNVTSTGFTAALVASDFGSTSTETIPFDYGDVQVARAGLNLVMSLLKWVETQNTDVGLLALKDKRESGGLSLESLLAMYPDLLKASATATEAQTEFVDRFGKAISYYLNFSAFANPAPGSTGARRLDAEEAFFTLTTPEDRQSEQRLAQDCVRLQTSLAATSAVAGLQSFSLPTSGFEGTLAVQASPWVFFKHAPGWRSELPAFKKNAYVPGTLRADTAIAFYPALRLDDIGHLEAELAAAELGLTEWFKTGRETVPPTLQLSTLSSGAGSVTLQNGAALATNGWLTVSGTVADATGVGRVMVTRTSGVDVASAVASVVERTPATGAAARVYDWTAQLPAGVGAGTISATAWDFSGNTNTTSATVTLSAAAVAGLPLVPEQAREVVVGGAGALAVVVPTAGTVQFTWRRNGGSLQSGTASAVDDWASVSIGGDHTAAIKRDGTLWTWGSNANGQLGAGTNRQFPQRVGNGSNWASVSCGKNFTVALTLSGSLWVSGNSPFGNFQQLTALTGLTATSQTWARISASDAHALALTRDGRLFVWSNGTGTSVDSGTQWAEIAAGNGRSARMNFAIKRDGTLWAWGDNTNGNLGLGWGSNGTVSSPAQVGTDRDWLTVATCTSNTWSKVLSAAVKKDGTLWAWGFAPDLFPDRSQRTPRRVGPQDARWAYVAVAEYSVLGTRPDGRLFEIGNDWTSAKPVSASVVSAVAAGYSHGVVGADGVLWMWGWNNFGQLGNYTPRDLSNPGQAWRSTYAPDPIQVGVNPDWDLPSPVRGIPVPLSFEPISAEGLGAYSLTITRGTSSTTSSASFYSWQQPEQPYVFAIGGGSLRLQGGINAGSSAVSYQWYKNGVAVPGGTSPELLIPAVPGNAGSYWVQAVSGKATIRGRAIAAVVDSANLSQAREALNVRDFSTASSKLNLALAANPVDGAALFLRSALDLYNLWSDPGVATNLAALGFTGSADPLNSTLRWSAEGFPKGALSAPVRAWLIGTLYPKIVAAEANLAKITDTGFLTSFGPYELGLQGEDSVVDYGDVQVLRAFLNVAMAAVKWLETQNTDVDLAALQLDGRNGRLSIESLLAKYPLLLTASTTGTAAQAEFVSRFKQALERYKAFSDFVNPAGTPTLAQRQDQSIGTARLETTEDRDSEREFRDAVNKILESINAADAVAGRRTLQTADGFSLTASPHAFFQHAPGWRNDLPRFSRNLYQRNSLNRSLLQSLYPAMSLSDVAGLEDSMIAAEPEWTKALGTRADSTPPVLEMTPVTALGSYDGWVNLEGTVQDAAGVRRVTVAAGPDGTKEVFEADLEELIPAADGTRLYRWRVALPLYGTGVGPLAFALSAEDVFGGVLDSPIVKVLPVERMVPLAIASRGEGNLTYTVTPAADANGFVRVGAKLVLLAKPKAGNLLRRIETVVDGETLPQPAYRSSTLTLTIRGETAVSAVFEPNPYLRIGGRNRIAGAMLRDSSDGYFPMSSLQVALSPAGSFSGRLRVGLVSYALAGRFDADGFYAVRLPQQFAYLSWNGQPSQFVRPMLSPTSVELKMWVDTSNGVDAPVLQAEFGGWLSRGTLTALAEKDYSGQPVFTGYLAGGQSAGAGYQNVGISEAARQLWNRTPGWWSVSARKSGTAVLTGWVPGRGRFASSGYLSNQATLGYVPGAPSTAPGEYADIQMLTSVNADTALRWLSTLYTPAAGNSSVTGSSAPAATGAVRTEMWYPGNRGPVFESVSPSAVGTNPYVAFASVGTLGGVGFTPAVPGQTLAPFVTTGPGGNTSRRLAAKFAFGGVSGANQTPSLKAFELQSLSRNVVSVAPGSVSYLTSPQMSLNAASGVLSGSAQVGGKRVSLQGVLLQRTFMNGSIPQSLQNVFGLGMTSDGDPFILTEPTP
jgi:alpha-tubulin suppressor-like RCC1 family protein